MKTKMIISLASLLMASVYLATTTVSYADDHETQATVAVNAADIERRIKSLTEQITKLDKKTDDLITEMADPAKMKERGEKQKKTGAALEAWYAKRFESINKNFKRIMYELKKAQRQSMLVAATDLTDKIKALVAVVERAKDSIEEQVDGS